MFQRRLKRYGGIGPGHHGHDRGLALLLHIADLEASYLDETRS